MEYIVHYIVYVAIYSSIEYVATCVQTMSLHSCIGDVIVMIRTDLTEDRKGVFMRIDNKKIEMKTPTFTFSI